MFITRRSFLAASPTILALFPSTGLAADPWVAKKSEDWTAKDISAVLNRSPWAKEVDLELSFGEASGGLPGGGGMPGGGPPGGPGGMPGGGGPPGGGMPPGMGRELKALIRWESALPVREARKKELPPAPNEGPHYVVSISGLPFTPGAMPRGGDSPRNSNGRPPRQESQEAMVQELMSATSIKRNGKDPINPDHVELIDGETGSMILIYFALDPKTIQASDKQVEFVSRVGPLAIKARFTLKDMVYRGKLEM